MFSVKKFLYNQRAYRVFADILCIAIFIGLFLTASSGYSQDLSSNFKNKEDEIHISSDTLMVDSQASYAEFIGNVKATQGNIIITADNLKIFYSNVPDGKKSKTSDVEDAINKIIAQGHVRIVFDDKQAESEQAVYMAKEKVFVLSGENTKITIANHSISGSKITLYRADGRIKIERSKEKQVEATYYPGEEEQKQAE